MPTLNKIEYAELTNKLKEINMLSIKAESSMKKLDNLIENNINTGIGIWDGESASEFINRWNSVKDEIPTITNILRTQTDNIKNMIDKNKEIEE